MSNFPLGGLRDFDHVIPSDDGDCISIRVEADAFAGDIVDDDSVEIL